MDFDDTYGLEDWEGDKILFEKEDWKGLLKLRQKRAEQHPSDLYAQQRLGEALVLNKKYSEALEFLTPLYQKDYESGFGIPEIIDALIGLGKTENDFNWLIKPKVLKLDSDTSKLCAELLRPKRKYVSISDLYCDLMISADYLTFKEKDLSDYLVKYPDTFDIKSDSEYFWDIKLKLKRK